MVESRGVWLVLLLAGCVESLSLEPPGVCAGADHAIWLEPESGAGDPIEVDEAWVVYQGVREDCEPVPDSLAWTCGSEPGTYEAWLKLDPWGESANLEVVVDADSCGLPMPETVVLIVSLPDDPLP